ncbi:hypothetical protein LMG18091_01508 [Ralstonia wenshanensis]|uniref:Alpha/beta hydrolase n=1 Tax=Ralstonia wenshanensis TaxID=2842456 RepID=A0AAD2AUW5_9RALS|nr:hypothetical protein LMG18091_01508 [Ralstonia wenshanensis]
MAGRCFAVCSDPVTFRQHGYCPRMVWKRWLLPLGVIVLAGLYLILPAILLRWHLDQLVFTSSRSATTHEAQRFETSVGVDTTVLIRRYGAPSGRCAYFFPGQHGGMGTYERTLFPFLLESGTTIYAISYPGQDGARGRSHLVQLPDQVETAIRFVARTAGCEAGQRIFVGRSFGATVALLEAERLHPEGVIVDGLGADLAVVVRAWIARHTIFWGWQFLPIERILAAQRYAVGPMLTKLAPTPVAVFQGAADTVTPFSAAQAVASRHANVMFYPVAGGRHENSYVLARTAYLEVLHRMLASPRTHVVEHLALSNRSISATYRAPLNRPHRQSDRALLGQKGDAGMRC